MPVLLFAATAGCFRSGFGVYGDRPADAAERDHSQRDAGSEERAPQDGPIEDAYGGDASAHEGGMAESGPADGARGDSSAFVVSSTRLVGGAAHYVEIDVDWSRGLVYLASQRDGICFEVIDVADEIAPMVHRQIGTSTAPAGVADGCRGLQLYDGDSRLVIGSHDDSSGTGHVEVWDLGADPRVDLPSRIDSLRVDHTRRVAFVDERGVDPVFYLSNRSGVRSFLLQSSTLSQLAAWTGGGLEADATMVGDRYLLTGGWGPDARLQLVDKDAMTLQGSFGMATGQANTSWSAAISADGLKVFFGGWVSAFLRYQPGALPELSVTHRFDNDSTYRDAVFVDDGGITYLYAVRADLVLDVFDVSDILRPTLVSQTAFPGGVEAYGVRVSTSSRRVVMCTTGGDLVIGDIDRMSVAPVASPYPVFSPSDLFSVSAHKLNPVHSYVFVDVDWRRQLAYASSIENGICFDMIDFADETAPYVAARFGVDAAADFATTCNFSRGIALFDDATKLLATSLTPGAIEVWDLGPSPRDLSFTQLSTLSGMDARRVAAIERDSSLQDWRLYLSLRSGVQHFIFDPIAPALVAQGAWSGSTDHNDATVIGGKYFLTGGWPDGAPISVVDIDTMAEVQSIGMDNGGTSGMWTAETSTDQTRAFLGGWVAAFLRYEPGAAQEIVATYRFDSSDTACYRDAVFVEHGGRVYLFALQNDLVLDVFDATDVDNPVLTFRTEIPAGDTEAYSLKVDTATMRAIIVTNEGDFITGDLYDMTPARAQHPTFTPR